MKIRSLKESLQAQMDISVVVMIGVAFAALMVVAFIIFKLKDQLAPTGSALNSINNITKGFDSAVNLILVAITVFILAIAIGALLMLRGR
jgi:amino acid transporter